MKVVLFCGGFGMRLRNYSEAIPKPMVQIGYRPILWHVMKYYAHHGHRDFILCLGWKANIIKDYFLNYRSVVNDVEIDLGSGSAKLLGEPQDLCWKIRIQDSGVNTLTGSRIKAALKYIDDDVFLATYGDGVANVDVADLIEHHEKSGKLATVTAVRPSSRFGELSLDHDTVQSFVEKPQTGEGWINGGFFVLSKAVFDDIPESCNVPLEAGVLEQLAARGELSVYRHTGFWQCMDTYRELCLLQEYWQDGRAPWKSW